MQRLSTLLAVGFVLATSAEAFAQVSTVYTLDLRTGTPSTLRTWPVNATGTGQATTLSSTATFDGFGLDFNTAGTTLYGIQASTATLNPNGFGTVDPLTGNFTQIAPLTGLAAGDAVTGLRVDPTNNTFYVSTNGTAGNTLNTLNPTTGVLTPVAPIVGGTSPLFIDIAISNTGQMYGHDINSDSLFLIDKATGAATLIGPTGFAANFAQGMDFDSATNTLYATIYTGGGTGAFVSFNLATGAATSLFSTTALNAEMEMAIRTSPVPEPTSLALVGLGAIGYGWRRLRKKA